MKLPKSDIKKIAIFRALQLGDMLCAIPAFRALRKSFPDAEITLLGLPWAKMLVERFPVYLDHFIHFPGYPGLPEQSFDALEFHQFTGKMIEKQYDLILQMQGNGSIVNPMIELFGATYTAGFCLKDDYAPNKEFFMEYPEGIHEVERHLKLMRYLGIDALDTAIEFPIYPQDEEDLKLSGLSLQQGKYVCVHPGSRGAWRQWPPEYFARLTDRCTAEGLEVVLTGTREELFIVQEVESHMKHKPLIAAGKTSIGAVALLIRDAFLLISNCTGVSHIAAALKTPSVVISMDGEPERWAPMNKDLHRAIDWTKNPDFSAVASQLEYLITSSPQWDQIREGIRVSLKDRADSV